jgi:hypothetical protein
MNVVITIIFWIFVVYILAKKSGMEEENKELENIRKKYGLTQTEVAKLKNMTPVERKSYLLQYNSDIANSVNRPGSSAYVGNYANNYKQNNKVNYTENYSKKVNCIHTSDNHKETVSNYTIKVPCIHKDDDGPIKNKIVNKDTFSSEDDDEAIKYL